MKVFKILKTKFRSGEYIGLQTGSTQIIY